MSTAIVTQIVEQVRDLPDPLQQQVLIFIQTLRQPTPSDSNAWDVLESLIATIEAPADWSSEHDQFTIAPPLN